jgi:hypothetical protein
MEQVNEEELLKNAQEAAEKLEKRFEELAKEISDKGYDKRTYAKDSVVEIPGTLFAQFTTYMADRQKYMAEIQKVCVNMANSLDMALQAYDNLTVALMEQHIKNCAAGKTISHREQDKEDAIERIQLIKE